MKTSVPLKLHTVRIVPILITILCAVAIDSQAQWAPAATLSTESKDSIRVEKQITSKKYKIRLYPNYTQQVLFFSASGEQGKVYQLFVFDMDGQLIKQANIRNRQTTVINNIDKGMYSFEVFSDDERIENGTLSVR